MSLPPLDPSVLLPVANFQASSIMMPLPEVCSQIRTIQQIYYVLRRERRRGDLPRISRKIAMWKHYDEVLYCYGHHLEKSINSYFDIPPIGDDFMTHLPPWFGNPEIHASHRAFLLKRNPEHYGQFGWSKKRMPLKFPVPTVLRETGCATCTASGSLVNLEE